MVLIRRPSTSNIFSFDLKIFLRGSEKIRCSLLQNFINSIHHAPLEDHKFLLCHIDHNKSKRRGSTLFIVLSMQYFQPFTSLQDRKALIVSCASLQREHKGLTSIPLFAKTCLTDKIPLKACQFSLLHIGMTWHFLIIYWAKDELWSDELGSWFSPCCCLRLSYYPSFT